MIKFSYRKHGNFNGQLTRAMIDKVIRRSLCNKYQNIILNIEVVDIDTSRALNLEYRGKDYPTNVISLEYPDMREKFNMLSGDLILSHDVILKEALEQNKTIEHHYIHMLVHGILHLQGYDHVDDDEANIMEQIEIDVLETFQINNPYINL